MDAYYSKIDTIARSLNKTTRCNVYRKFKVTNKYVPDELPVNPNTSYKVSEIHINKKYPKENLGEDLSVALAEAIRGGKDNLEDMVAVKYQYLQSDLGKMLQDMQGYTISQSETTKRHLLWGGVDMDIKFLDEKLICGVQRSSLMDSIFDDS